MGTFVDGIGASQNIDSSGEIVDIAGLDISSLEVDGTLNWEHKKDVPDQLVGKILKAKKIFTDKDCEDDRQKYFWDKCRVPYLYICGELLDDYTDSARTVAGQFRYDLDHRGQNAKDIIGFSVEGATIQKVGNTIARSIARKITITSLPCNKVAVAEMVPKEVKKPKDNLDNIFKTESYVEIEVLQLNEKPNLWELLKKEAMKVKAAVLPKAVKKDEQALTSGAGTSMALGGGSPTSPSLSLSEPDMAKALPPKLAVAKPNPLGSRLGATSTGKDVHSHAMVGQTGFSAHEHAEAASLHQKAANANPKMAQHHNNKAALHNSAAISMKDRAIKHATATAAHTSRPGAAPASPKTRSLHDPRLSGTIKYKKSEVLAPGEKGDSVSANQKQQRERRAQESPNNDKRHWDQHKINHSESNPQNVKRESIPNKQVLHPTPQAGQPKNNMLHNKILAPKETMHKAAAGSSTSLGGAVSSVSITDTAAPAAPKPKKVPLGQITKSMTAGSGLASPDRLTGGAALAKESLEKCGCGMAKCATCGPKRLQKDAAYSNNAPKDRKIKELQGKIDAGTYKPDAAKTGEAMLNHASKPLKGTKVQKSETLQRAESEYASWEKREEFELFMKSRMPHLTKGEIKAFGQAMILNKSVKMEKSLNGLLGLLKEEPKK